MQRARFESSTHCSSSTLWIAVSEFWHVDVDRVEATRLSLFTGPVGCARTPWRRTGFSRDTDVNLSRPSSLPLVADTAFRHSDSAPIGEVLDNAAGAKLGIPHDRSLNGFG